MTEAAARVRAMIMVTGAGKNEIWEKCVEERQGTRKGKSDRRTGPERRVLRRDKGLRKLSQEEGRDQSEEC